MKKSSLWILILALGAVVFSLGLLFVFGAQQSDVHSTVSYTENPDTDAIESIPDESVPMAAPLAEEAVDEEIAIVNAFQPADEATHTNSAPTTQVQTGSSESTPVEPVISNPDTEDPAPQAPSDPEPPKEDPAPPQEPETPEEPETPATPTKAVKPSDITDVKAMAKYLFDAGTEFWAVEKNFCGTTTRPVSTRVASAIGGGTAVDCPGGDTVRIDKNGVAHDSYAIADHFREYVDMPDLQYFKLYLSDKDYTVNPYGAREEVTGSYYQYGSERATYEPEEEAETGGTTSPS